MRVESQRAAQVEDLLLKLDSSYLRDQINGLKYGHDAPVPTPLDYDGESDSDNEGGATVFVEAFSSADKKKEAEMNLRRRLLWLRAMKQHAVALDADLDSFRAEKRDYGTSAACWAKWRRYNVKSRHRRRHATQVQAHMRAALARARVKSIKRRLAPALIVMYRCTRCFLAKTLLARKRDRRRYLTPLVAMLNVYPERLIAETSTRVETGDRSVPAWAVPCDPQRKWKRMTAVLNTGIPRPVYAFDRIWESAGGNATGFITPPSLVACEAVCKAWRNMLHDPTLAQDCWRNWLWLPKEARKRRTAIRAELLAERRARAASAARGGRRDDGASVGTDPHADVVRAAAQGARRVELDCVLRQLEGGAMPWRTAVASQRVALRLEKVAAKASLSLNKKMQRLKQPSCALPDWQSAAADRGGSEAAAVRVASVEKMWKESKRLLEVKRRKAGRKKVRAAAAAKAKAVKARREAEAAAAALVEAEALAQTQPPVLRDDVGEEPREPDALSLAPGTETAVAGERGVAMKVTTTKKVRRKKRRRRKNKARKKTTRKAPWSPEEKAIALLRAAPEPWLTMVLPVPPIGNTWRQYRSRRFEDREPRLPKPWYGCAAKGWLEMMMREAPHACPRILVTLLDRQDPPPPAVGPRGTGDPLDLRELLTLGALDRAEGWASPAVAGGNSFSGTLLMRAARWGCTEVVHLLLSFGAETGLQAVPPPPPSLLLWGFRGADLGLTVRVPVHDPAMVAGLRGGGRTAQDQDKGQGKEPRATWTLVHKCSPASYCASWIEWAVAAAKALSTTPVSTTLRLQIDPSLQKAPRPEQLGKHFTSREASLRVLFRLFGGERPAPPRPVSARTLRLQRFARRTAAEKRNAAVAPQWKWQPSIPPAAELPPVAPALTKPQALRRARMDARIAIARREFAGPSSFLCLQSLLLFASILLFTHLFFCFYEFAVDQEVAAARFAAETAAADFGDALAREDATEELMAMTRAANASGRALQINARRAGTALALHTLNRRRWAEVELDACRASLPWIQLLEEACDAMRGNIGRPACWLTNVSKALKEVLSVMQLYKEELDDGSGARSADALILQLRKLTMRLNVLEPIEMLEEATSIVDSIVELRLAVAYEVASHSATQLGGGGGEAKGEGSSDERDAPQPSRVAAAAAAAAAEAAEPDAPAQWSVGIDAVADALPAPVPGRRRMHGTSRQRADGTASFGETACAFRLGSVGAADGFRLAEHARSQSPLARTRAASPATAMGVNLARWQLAKLAVRAQSADNVVRDAGANRAMLRSALRTASAAAEATRTTTVRSAAASLRAGSDAFAPFATLQAHYDDRLPSRPFSATMRPASSSVRLGSSSSSRRRAGVHDGAPAWLPQSRRRWTAGAAGRHRDASPARLRSPASPSLPLVSGTPRTSSPVPQGQSRSRRQGGSSGDGGAASIAAAPGSAAAARTRSRDGADASPAPPFDARFTSSRSERDAGGGETPLAATAAAPHGDSTSPRKRKTELLRGAEMDSLLLSCAMTGDWRSAMLACQKAQKYVCSLFSTKHRRAHAPCSPAVLTRRPLLSPLSAPPLPTSSTRRRDIALRQLAFRRMTQACRSATPPRPDLIVRLMEMLLEKRDWRTDAEQLQPSGAPPLLAKASTLAFASKSKSKSKSPRMNRTGGGFSGGNLVARAIVVDCNIAIAACGACESWRSALAVVRLMRNAGLESRYTPATWVALRGALQCATLDEASTAFDSMIASGLPLELTQEVTARISRRGATSGPRRV